MRSLLLGGGRRYEKECAASFDETKHMSSRLLSRDETFPLYEDRSVRPDPLGLRQSFPCQTLGWKMTVGVQKPGADWVPVSFENEELIVRNDVGIENVEVLADASAWGRVAVFLTNADNAGYDPRWDSGDWGSVLSRDMLARPSEQLRLDCCTQPLPSLHVDENKLVSSDNFEVTLRCKKVGMRIPAAIPHYLRSCEVTVGFEELVVEISSSLPRCLHELDERGDVFPHSTSDTIHRVTLPSSDLASQSTTTRLKLYVKELLIQLQPIVPVVQCLQSRRLLSLSRVGFLICLDSALADDDSKLHLQCILSTEVESMDVRIDMDLFVPAASTLLHHVEKMSGIMEKVTSDVHLPNAREGSTKAESEGGGDNNFVAKQLERGRTTGGVHMSVWVKLTYVSVSVWRHCVTRLCPLQPTDNEKREFIPELRILELSATSTDLGVDVDLEQSITSRMWLSTSKAEAKVSKAYSSMSPTAAENKQANDSDPPSSVFISIGGGTKDGVNGLAMRFDQSGASPKAYCFSCDLADGIISFPSDDVVLAVIACLEAVASAVGADGASNLSSILLEATSLFEQKDEVHLLEKPEPNGTATFPDLIAKVKDWCEICLVRFRFRDMIFDIPALSKPASTGKQYTIQMANATVDSSLFFTDQLDCNCLLECITYGNIPWKDLLANRACFAEFTSTQCIVSSKIDATPCIGPFTIKVKCSNSCISTSISDVANLPVLVEFQELLLYLERYSLQLDSYWANIKSHISRLGIFGSIRQTMDEMVHAAISPIEHAVESATLSVASIRRLLTQISGRVARLKQEETHMLAAQSGEVLKLKREIFLKERERLSAIAYCGADLRGWLKTGSAKCTGQRSVLSSSLWPHWVVLRGKLLFLYESTNEVSSSLCQNGESKRYQHRQTRNR